MPAPSILSILLILSKIFRSNLGPGLDALFQERFQIGVLHLLFGLKAQPDNVPAIALGAREVSPLDMRMRRTPFQASTPETPSTGPSSNDAISSSKAVAVSQAAKAAESSTD